MILSNDPRYCSHLAGAQGQLSILQILIEDVSERQIVDGLSDLPWDQQLVKSRRVAQHWQPIFFYRIVNLEIFNSKNFFTAILDPAAILKFYAWLFFFYFPAQNV
jgi:hypothetical protein